MSHSVYLVTSKVVKPEELTIFLKNIDAIIDDESGEKGYVLNGHAQVWIELVENAIFEYETEDIQKLHNALGELPKTFICLDISRNPGSGRLAIDVALAFSKQWYSIVDDLHENIYTNSDLQFLQSNGGEL